MESSNGSSSSTETMNKGNSGSSNSSHSNRNSHLANNSEKRKRINDPADYASFLQISSKRRSSTKMRKAYRKAFAGYFSTLNNCKLNGKSANCQVDPNVHKTYYGIDIENCY